MSRRKNKSGLIIGGVIVGLVVLMAVAMALGSREKTYDFRGEVKKIIRNNNTITFNIAMDGINTSYIVVADEKTKVKSVHDDHTHDLKSSEIKIGNTIEGDFKSKNSNIAKIINVHQH